MTGFTAHNIVLDDDTETLPGQPKLAESPWFLAAKRCLEALFPQGLSGLRIADLACLEGGYAAEFARMGFGEALGIEVRQNNYANCLFVQERLALPNLKFAKDDVWNLATYGTFDAIFCCGILYHLDAPRKFLSLMSQAARKAIIVNTHFSTIHPIANFNLSPVVVNEGLPGRWFNEGPVKKVESKWAAWSNSRSFWILREYLIEAIRSAGFPMVFEQFDFLGDGIADSMLKGFYKANNRSTFVGVKDAVAVQETPTAVM
jgi:hypothetical protein